MNRNKKYIKKKCVFSKMGNKTIPRTRNTELTKKKLKDRERMLKEWKSWYS